MLPVPAVQVGPYHPPRGAPQARHVGPKQPPALDAQRGAGRLPVVHRQQAGHPHLVGPRVGLRQLRHGDGGRHAVAGQRSRHGQRQRGNRRRKRPDPNHPLQSISAAKPGSRPQQNQAERAQHPRHEASPHNPISDLLRQVGLPLARLQKRRLAPSEEPETEQRQRIDGNRRRGAVAGWADPSDRSQGGKQHLPFSHPLPKRCRPTVDRVDHFRLRGQHAYQVHRLLELARLPAETFCVGRDSLDDHARQPHPVHHAATKGLAQQKLHRFRLHPIEHDPEPSAAQQPAADRHACRRVGGKTIAGQHQLVEPVQTFHHGREKVFVEFRYGGRKPGALPRGRDDFEHGIAFARLGRIVRATVRHHGGGRPAMMDRQQPRAQHGLGSISQELFPRARSIEQQRLDLGLRQLARRPRRLRRDRTRREKGTPRVTSCPRGNPKPPGVL